MRYPTPLLGAAALLAAFAAPIAASSQTPATATAEIADAAGQSVGNATFTETPHGVLIRAELTGLPPGEHGFHLHETGQCAPPFETAGGHFNPTGAQHGLLNAAGPHAGDMPNIHVPDGGAITLAVLNTLVTLAEGETSLLDADGSALMVHAMADDYATDPAGEAGDRIACGVVTAD
ncbi:MAG: superoxide dismutase family protein [Bauldia sp.]|nr:superoxide dismutase family protein [Bauldia sp.]